MPDILADTDTGFGVAFVRSVDGGTTWQPVTQVFEFKVPGATAETYDATHAKSPGGWREKGKGLLAMDEFTIRMQFSTLTTALADFYTDLKNKDLMHYGFLLPDDAENSPSLTVAAHCTGVDPETPIDNRQVATITFEPSGKGDWI